jgi:hypothetical protein
MKKFYESKVTLPHMEKHVSLVSTLQKSVRQTLCSERYHLLKTAEPVIRSG